MAKYIFGIDLGTTYSCIAYVDESGRATVVQNKEGAYTTPSVAYFADVNNVSVGQFAKETAVIEPEKTISLVKTMMGKTDVAINYEGQNFSPEQVSAEILKKIVKDASELLDTEVKDVVITCPAYFGTAERTATRNAGKIAGLNVIEIINEPTAAALYYGITREQEDKTVLVYDLGGGTFDVTIMALRDGKVEVICADGNDQLGGKDWDDVVVQYLDSEFRSEHNFDDAFDEHVQQDLRIKAERAKQQLSSSREEVPVILDALGLRTRTSLSRTVFDEITQSLLLQTIEKTDAAIAEAEKKGYTIDEILLVGGSSRMPQVRQALAEKYNIEPKFLDPDEAVAKGAAIYALGAYQDIFIDITKKIESGEINIEDEGVREEVKKFSEPATVNTTAVPGLGGQSIKEMVTVATTKSYALKVISDGKEKCCNMIIKNESMENGTISVSKQFGTIEANQNDAEIIVYESDIVDEFFEVDEDYILGKTVLSLPGNLPAGAPIQVTFSLDKEGILKVTGEDVTTNNIIEAEMHATGGVIMSDEEVAVAKEKSKGITVD